jgi:hypothetical protein
MKNSLAIKSSTALLIVALIYAVSPSPITAQATEKPSPFGSSLKPKPKNKQVRSRLKLTHNWKTSLG